MDNITDIFSEPVEAFTVYVVEQEFAVNRGHEYFKQFLNKKNFISNEATIKKKILSILSWIQKKVPNTAELIEKCFSLRLSPTKLNIIEVITSLNKLFTITEHQAAGPEVIDPIIIEEAYIDKKYLTQLITLHRESVIQPTIIIILRDNDFDRAKVLLSNCPNNINVKFIRNSGNMEIYKIINSGADDIESFIDSFARQCFSTCSKTKRNIILNTEWSKIDILHKYSPSLFKARTNLLFDEKKDALNFVNEVIENIEVDKKDSKCNKTLLKSFEFTSKLFRVYCKDCGGSDIKQASSIAEELNIDLLKAQLYRYSQFIPNLTREEQKTILLKAQSIFEKNNVKDHALYCKNNYLVHDFYSKDLKPRLFKELQEEASNSVPGLVGMSIILNNVGVACLYSGDLSEAIKFFNKGLGYSNERVVQKIGIMSNILVTKACDYKTVEECEIFRLLDMVFENLEVMRLPFIAANYIMNMVLIIFQQHRPLISTILNKYKIHEVINSALRTGILGSGSLMQQLIFLNAHYSESSFSNISIPKQLSPLSGIREDFIIKRGFNPVIFNAWL